MHHPLLTISMWLSGFLFTCVIITRSDRGTEVFSPVGLHRNGCFCSAYIKAPICVLAGGSMGRSGEARCDDVRGGGLASFLLDTKLAKL